MMRVADHLSAAELQAGWRRSKDAPLARHYQVIWLLAEGRSCAEVARRSGFVRRWVEELRLVDVGREIPETLSGGRRDEGGDVEPFEALYEDMLGLFARGAGAGRDRIILLVLDGAAGTPRRSRCPRGIRPVYLPPHTPELQPAETLWTHVGEPIVNSHFDTLEQLDAVVAERRVKLRDDRDLIQGQAGFHWWPDRVAAN
jgi:hypothetical protein